MYYEGSFIRLIGVRVDNLIGKDEVQLSLFSQESDKRQEKIDKTVDEIKEKYGYDFITRAGKMKVDNIINIKQ